MRRDHSIIACSRHIYIVLFFAHIPFVANPAFSATPAERLQQDDAIHFQKQLVPTRAVELGPGAGARKL